MTSSSYFGSAVATPSSTESLPLNCIQIFSNMQEGSFIIIFITKEIITIQNQVYVYIYCYLYVSKKLISLFGTKIYFY